MVLFYWDTTKRERRIKRERNSNRFRTRTFGHSSRWRARQSFHPLWFPPKRWFCPIFPRLPPFRLRMSKKWFGRFPKRKARASCCCARWACRGFRWSVCLESTLVGFFLGGGLGVARTFIAFFGPNFFNLHFYTVWPKWCCAQIILALPLINVENLKRFFLRSWQQASKIRKLPKFESFHLFC